MNVRYIAELEELERQHLVKLISRGKLGARKMKRAQILLMADLGKTDKAISEALPTGTSTIYRVKRRFVEEGLTPALSDRARPGANESSMRSMMPF